MAQKERRMATRQIKMPVKDNSEQDSVDNSNTLVEAPAA
jgi:hypothetical protein